MAAGTLVRRVMLTVTADDADAAEKLEQIKLKADELRAQFPEMVARINTAEASAKLKVLKDELAEAAAQSDAEPLEIKVNSAEAQAKLDAIKRNAIELRELNPRLTPYINDAEASAQLAVLRGELRETEDTGVLSAEGVGKAWEVTKYTLLGVAGGLAYGGYKAIGFWQEMTRVSTQAGVAKSQLGGLGAQVLGMAGVVGQGPGSLAEALYHVESNMASMGAKAPQVLNAVEVAAKGADVGGSDLVDTTNALGAAIASGIPGVKNYDEAMGALNATVGAGDMTMQNLAEAMGTGFLSNVKIYGSTLNDVGAMLATFGDNNIRGAAAGTQLRMSVQALAVQAKTAGPYLKELGLQAGELGKYQSAHGTVATIDLLVQKMHAAGVTSKEEGNVITELFGKKAGAGIAVLVDQVDRLNSKVPALEAGAKGFGQAWAQQSQTPAQRLKNLEMGSEALAITLGTKLLPMGNRVLGWADNFVNGLQHGNAGALAFAGTVGTVLGLVAMAKAEEGIEGVVKSLENLGKGVAGGIGDLQKFASGFSSAEQAASDSTGAWGSFGGVARGALNGIKNAAIGAAEKLGLLTTAQEAQTVATEEGAVAQGELDVAEDSNPIGLIIIAIAALAVGIYELVTHWKTVWHAITSVTDDAVHWIEGHWKLLVEILATAMLGPMGLLISYVATHFKQVLHLITGAGHNIAASWKMMTAWLVDPVGMAVFEIRKHTHEIAKDFDGLRHDVAAILDDTRHLIARAWDGIRHDAATAMDNNRHQIAQAWDGIRHDAAAAVGETRHLIAQAWDLIRHDTAALADAVVRYYEQLPGRILHVLEALPDEMLHLGQDVIMGLIHGLEAELNALNSVVSNIASTVEKAFTNPLGIFSPSRVMREHGRNVVRGAILGVQDEAPELRAAMRQMGLSIAPNGTLMASRVTAGSLVPAGAGAAGGGTQKLQLELEWVGGGADQALITLLKNHIRVRGGNPGVLGR